MGFVCVMVIFEAYSCSYYMNNLVWAFLFLGVNVSFSQVVELAKLIIIINVLSVWLTLKEKNGELIEFGKSLDTWLNHQMPNSRYEGKNFPLLILYP
jgi:hypothetical protein